MSEQTKRQATSEEMSMVKDLTRCVFVPASFDKRFVHSGHLSLKTAENSQRIKPR